MSDGMNKSERQELARLARLRAKQAKNEATQREKVLLSEIEDMLTAEYEARDEMWSEAVAIAEEAAQKANETIRNRCVDLGIPAKQAPQLTLGWQARGRDFSDPRRQAEVRKLAKSKLAALTETAKTEIDRQALDTETTLIAGGLESDDAHAFLEQMPTAEQLMPALQLDDLNVKHWQAPEGMAGELLTPSTPADRKRKQVLRAIEANPDASNRKVAELAGCDHKTVAAYRNGAAGELTSEAGEVPDDRGELPEDL